LPNDSWIWYFWIYYFQLGTWINFQSNIVVPSCCAYLKIFILWITVKTPMMDLAIPCGYCLYCCRFVDGKVSTSATFKLRHTSINWVLLWDIETLVLFRNKGALRLAGWLLSVEIHNKGYKTLHEHGWNEEIHFIKGKVVKHIVKVSIEKATLILHTYVTY
jgi:hypothetical protein